MTVRDDPRDGRETQEHRWLVGGATVPLTQSTSVPVPNQKKEPLRTFGVPTPYSSLDDRSRCQSSPRSVRDSDVQSEEET